MKINFKELLKKYNLSKDDVGKQLFPKNRYPAMAFDRIIKGKSHLNELQISKLAKYLGISIFDLYKGSWKRVKSKDSHVFDRNNFRVHLDTSDWTSRLFHKSSLIHEEIISSENTPLGEYFNILDKLIVKLEKNECN